MHEWVEPANNNLQQVLIKRSLLRYISPEHQNVPVQIFNV